MTDADSEALPKKNDIVYTMSDDQKHLFLQGIRTGHALRDLSPVATKLIELASNDHSSVSDLARLIEKDPSLTVRVLRLANAAFLLIGEHVTTVEEAIQRIGLNRIRMMALALSLRDAFPMGKVGHLDYEEFWRGSLYRAMIAKSLAKELLICKPEEAFIAGLTLEIGFLLLYDMFIKGKDEITDIKLYPLEYLLGWEEEHFGINHRELGEEVLKFWHFPQSITECQRIRYEAGPVKGNLSLISICDMARSFVDIIVEKSAEWRTSFMNTEALYGISNEALTNALATAFDEVQTIAESLKLEMNERRDIARLIGKAKDALNRLSEATTQWKHYTSGQSLPICAHSSPQTGNCVMKDKFCSIASEIKAPLKTIMAFAKKLNERLDPQSEEWEQTQSIIEQSEKMEQVLTAVA